MIHHVQDLLQQALPKEEYLLKWFSHRSRLSNWPKELQEAWAPKLVQRIVSWVKALPQPSSSFKEREERLKSLLLDHLNHVQEDVSTLSTNHSSSLTILLQTFLMQTYPQWSDCWRFFLSFPLTKNRLLALQKLWQEAKKERFDRNQARLLAQELPFFHREILLQLHKRLEAEKALHSIFIQADLGWDLEHGRWKHLNLEPLIEAARSLEKEKEIQRIAELIGRDHRIQVQTSSSPPEPTKPPQEPGKTEIRGIVYGRSLSDALSHEAMLLSSQETEGLFFQKEAEGRLICWDYVLPNPPIYQENKMFHRQAKNERGPMILVLDTSGSMRGKPEYVAKLATLALVRIGIEENRCCYLINFSSQIRTFVLNDLQRHLEDLLNFLSFSFHGGTDLTPALREALHMMKTKAFRRADVLILSDFAVPKIPTLLRQEMRHHQNSCGSRFYALTTSARPLNDMFHIFDASWAYNIQAHQKEGIDPETLRYF